MSRCWLAVLEDETDGMWNSNPIGAFSQEQILKLSETIPWGKRHQHSKEVLVIYECFERFVFESPEAFKKFMGDRAVRDKIELRLTASILSSAANSGGIRTSQGLAIWIAAIGDFDLDYLM